MEVSIIVPVYNVAPYIEQCIRSVMAQTFDGSMECLIIDDCGTDESMTIVKNMVSKYDGTIRFNIIHHEFNRGLSAARNTGIKFATGDYIYFLDSDDWINDKCIELLMRKIKENPSLELVQARNINDNREFGHMFSGDILLTTNDDIREVFYNTFLFQTEAWNKLIKYSIISKNKILFKEGIIFEDVLWDFYLVKYLSNICLIPEATYYFRTRPHSIRTSSKEKRQADSLRIIYMDIIANLTTGYEKQEFNYFARKVTLYYTKYIHIVPKYKDLLIEYKKKAWLYGTCTTILKLEGARLLGNFQNGHKIVYWLKINKMKIDNFIKGKKGALSIL